MKHVAICGGNGVLGQRLARVLMQDRFHVLLLDDYEGFHKGNRRTPELETACKKGSCEHVQADLTQYAEWTSAFERADTVVQFAAVNPYPEASWEESRLTMRMNANVIGAAQRAGVRRLVLASSSHVLGGHLQDGACVSSGASVLGPQTPLRGFTKFRFSGMQTDASAYAVAKVAMEEMAQAAVASTPTLSIVAIRIGWCQPGENRPGNMSATATPTISEDKVDVSVEEEVAQGFDSRDLILSWCHRLWLSTPDFEQLFKCAIQSSGVKGYLCVMGTSRNADSRWSNEGWDTLGYRPIDDVEQALKDDATSAKRQKTA